MKIALIGYRQWALDIYEKIANSYDYEFLRINSKEEFSLDLIEDFKPDYILFYGWSWIINKNLIEKFKCVMLHPSPLPKYRGGSPIQNQIINGETHSAVTIFLMDEGIDTGPILFQKKINIKKIDYVSAQINAILNGANLLAYAISFLLKEHAIDFVAIEEKSYYFSSKDFYSNGGFVLYNKLKKNDFKKICEIDRPFKKSRIKKLRS